MKHLLWEWLKAALVRALKTFAQTSVALIGVEAAAFGDVNWGVVLSVASLAALTSLLMSVSGLPEAAEGRSVPNINRMVRSYVLPADYKNGGTDD
jgi:hypothetical protein